MGVLPLEYKKNETAETLGLDGTEQFSILGIGENLYPLKELDIIAKKAGGTEIKFRAVARVDSAIEIEYYKHGGILQYVLRGFLKEA